LEPDNPVDSEQLCQVMCISYIYGGKKMDQGSVIDLAQKALMMVIFVSAPMLGLSLIVGLAISIFQATTQIQEQTLTFVPKILAILGAIMVFGSWMLKTLMEFMQGLLLNMNQYIK
jgi:flagellar biosynthetic protein FliQ